MKIPKFLSDTYWQIHNKKYFLLVAAFAILLNWAGNTFVFENSYKFLYFDMLGTFVAVIVLGSVWGILVALATAILLSNITSPHFIYLAVVNIIGALYWGILSESGSLAILKNKNYTFKASLKSNFTSSVLFILFAGIGCGLITAFFSSVVRGVIFTETGFDQPYSLYFAQWFKQVFEVTDVGWAGVMANYIADTFIEIPDKVLTTFFGIAICLTIFKFNITTLTNVYQEKILNDNISLRRIMLKNFGIVEIILFLALGIVYLLKIRDISFQMLTGFIEKVSLYSLQDYVFLEMIILPLFILLILLAMKFFMPGGENDTAPDLSVTVKDNFYIKNVDRDIKYFLADTFCLSIIVISIYMFILISITGISPIEYYQTTSTVKALPETLVMLLIMLGIFIFIDRRNNRITEAMTLNDELVKQQTVEEISESFDEQRQKLQVLELNWSDNTVEFLRSARHDLINQLEKSKTGLDELLVEVYDNVVKPYSNSILESQKEMRRYVEEITSGKLDEYTLGEIESNIEKIINSLRLKVSSYIAVKFEGFPENDGIYCKMNRLFFIAFNNILDNSVYMLQKKVLEPGFSANITVSLGIDSDKTISVSIADNAGGLSRDKLAKIYKVSIPSSKGERVGEGTMIAKNFIKLLNGYITVRNVRAYGENGLETSIHLPVYKK